MSTKHGHNIYDNEILDEFNYESNQTVTSEVICPLFKKDCYIWLCLHSFTCIYRPVSTKLGQKIYAQQNLYEFNHGSNWTGTTGVIWS